MVRIEKSNEGARFTGGFLSRESIITRRDLLIPALIVLSILGASLVSILPLVWVMAIIVAIPSLIVLLYIIKNPFIGVLLYFFLEFLRPYDLIPGLMKLRLAMFTVLITLISFIMHKAQTDRSIRWDRFNWFYLAFLIIIATTVATSANNFLAYNIFYSMAINVIIFVLSTELITTPAQLRKLLWLLLIILGYHSTKGILNLETSSHVYQGMATSGFVTSGFLKDENDFALAMNTFIPFSFFMIFYAKSKFQKVLSAGLLTTLTLAVVSSMSRGGWIGLMAVVFFLIWRSKKRARSFAIVAVLLIAAAVFAPPKYWSEISSISPNADTGEARIQYWQAAVRMFLDHPLTGVGAGNGGVWMPMYVKTPGRDPNTQWGATFHGTLPQVLAELGGLGMFIYLSMVIIALKRLNIIRKVRQDTENGRFLAFVANATMVGMVGYFVSAIFLSTAFYPELWTLFIFTFASYNLYKSMPVEIQSPEMGHPEIELKSLRY